MGGLVVEANGDYLVDVADKVDLQALRDEAGQVVVVLLVLLRKDYALHARSLRLKIDKR